MDSGVSSKKKRSGDKHTPKSFLASLYVTGWQHSGNGVDIPQAQTWNPTAHCGTSHIGCGSACGTVYMCMGYAQSQSHNTVGDAVGRTISVATVGPRNCGKWDGTWRSVGCMWER